MDEKILQGIDKKLKAILVAIALKENDRNKQILILKKGRLNQKEIIEIVGLSASALRSRKHRKKK